jgi:hypothetical protein
MERVKAELNRRPRPGFEVYKRPGISGEAEVLNDYDLRSLLFMLVLTFGLCLEIGDSFPHRIN